MSADPPLGAPPPLTRDEILRYARHLVLPEVGEAGQRRLKAARVLLIGAGGLGSPAALYLAAAGVGTIGIVDDDHVDVTNLQRQVLHGTAAIGRSKLESAAERMHDLNPHVVVEHHPVRLTAANALPILDGYDVVLDGSDNFPTRYLVNDACVLLGKPDVYGAILKWEGQVSIFAANGGPCYRCLFREPPPPGLAPNCAEGGVFGALPGIVGSLQAVEAIKWLLGAGTPLAGRLLLFDALDLSFRELRIARDPGCPVCGDRPTQTALIDYDVFCGVASAPGATASAVPAAASEPADPREISPASLAAALGGPAAPALVDVREMWEWDAGNLAAEGAIHIPLAELLDREDEVPEDAPVVFYCRTGNRSLDAVDRWRTLGRASRSLSGGLAAWKREVDPAVTVA